LWTVWVFKKKLWEGVRLGKKNSRSDFKGDLKLTILSGCLLALTRSTLFALVRWRLRDLTCLRQISLTNDQSEQNDLTDLMSVYEMQC